jgi:predicted MFS family arabinose efflux permease
MMAVAAALAVANAYYAQPLLAGIAHTYGIRKESLGIVITASQVGYGVGLLLLVPLGDLLDRRRLLAAQLLAAAGALLTVAAAPTTGVLMVGMVAVGILSVATQILVAYAASLASPDERGRVVGIVTSGIVLGILLARTIAGIGADVAGWRSVYLTASVVIGITAVILFRLLPRREVVKPRLRYWSLVGSVFQLWVHEPVLRVRGAIGFFIFASVTTLWTPLALPLSAPPFSLSYTEIGLFGLAGAAGAIAAAKAGGWADRNRAESGTFLALLTMILAWIPIALLPWSLIALVVGVVAIDFGLQATHVLNQTLIFRTGSEARSRLTAAYMLFYSAGCAAGAPVATFAYARAGWSAVCVVGMTLSLCALLVWALARKRLSTVAGW